MAAIKLYLVLLSEDGPAYITVHRDLLTLQQTWEECDRKNYVGLIHTGFIRPRIINVPGLLTNKGKVLVSVAAKWSLPDEYQCSVAMVAEMRLTSKVVPMYLLMKGLGYNLNEPNEICQDSLDISRRPERTIAEAALAVLNDSDRPLNKEEIFARIIEQGLYQFGAARPVSVLAVELNRYSKDTEYSNPAAKPLFAKSGKEHFVSLEKASTEFKDWLKELSNKNSELVNMAASYGVYCDKSFIANSKQLPDRLRDQLSFERFNLLRDKTDIADPVALVKILPTRIALAAIGSLDLPVRISNVFKANSIGCLADLSDLSVDDILKWPNFGRKSVSDLVANILTSVDRQSASFSYTESHSVTELDKADATPRMKVSDKNYQIELISALPLKTHFDRALDGLKDNERRIIQFRTGYNGTVMTLEAVGECIGVTRERIRQIQKKSISRIVEAEFWDDCIALRIGQLLIDRQQPLYIEMLEIEDPWFVGFMGNYQHLAAIIELFSGNEIKVIKINGASIVTRISAEAWEDIVRFFRRSLPDKASEGGWTRLDVAASFTAALFDKGAPELVPLLWDQFDSALQFDGEKDESHLVSFGITAESVIQAVLHQAEGPLHFTEVGRRATALLGREVDERRAQNALMSQGAKLFGRGIYGLEKFNPINPKACHNISIVVCNMIYAGPLMKQWHASELLSALKAKFPALPTALDNYILNIILGNCEKLVYLNRMVWVRADSHQTVNDRVDTADAFTQILEDNGGPLKGMELKNRLSAIRGVPKNLQLQPTARMIQVGPDFWGLVDRDIGGAAEDNAAKLDSLYQLLIERQKGIHVSEVGKFVEIGSHSSELPTAYALFHLAQRDGRFYLARSMLLGLAEWEGDTRRLNISQAVRSVLGSMDKPMSIGEIHARVEELTEMPVDGTVTGILINEGAVYNPDLKVWYKG